MAKLTVGQSTAVRDLIRYLERAAADEPDDIYTADRAADALALLANAAQARMMAGPSALEAREAIGRLAGCPCFGRTDVDRVPAHCCSRTAIQESGDPQ